MKIAVRLDDITPDMDWAKFRRLEKILDRNNIIPLLGIVPDNQDNNLKRNPVMVDFKDQVQKWLSKDWVLAMHGWRHIYTTKKGGIFPLNNFSEFAGISKEQQREMICDGKEKLQQMGVNTDVFMAPAHSFDKNTLQVLRETGFHYITDGFGDVPYYRQGLIFLPIAFQKSKDIEKKDGYTTLVFHTNTMDEQDFIEFQKMIEKHKSDFVSYKEYLKIPAKKRSIISGIKEYTMATVKRILVRVYSFRKVS